jgi:hypothetical protein
LSIPPLKIFKCKRYKEASDNWRGALIIVASTEEEARAFFMDYGWGDRSPPESIEEIGIAGKGVIYDDHER